MSCVPKLRCHLSAPFVPLVPDFRRAVGITIFSAPLQPFPHLGQGLGQRDFSGIQSFMNSAVPASKNASKNKEESAVCLLKIELAFGYAGYKVILSYVKHPRQNSWHTDSQKP